MMKSSMLIVLLLLLPAAGAVDYPVLLGYVTDNANMIDPAYEQKITALAEKIEKETTAEIAVVTIESLEGEPKEMYAVKLFEKAGIGKKDKDNGLLILIAKQEREYRFEVGYGLEGTITDSMRVNIGERIIVPNFRDGEYGRGIYEAMQVIEGLLKGNEEVISEYQNSSTEAVPGWAIALFIGFIFAMVIVGIIAEQRHHRYRGGYGYGYPGRSWGSRGGGFGGGFGGFGGGRSGGGGFGGKW